MSQSQQSQNQQSQSQQSKSQQSKSQQIIDKTDSLGAHNYHPLPVVLSRGEGAWVWDVEGKRYLDMLSAYSALSHGHRHPRLVEALQQQLQQITLTSRAFHNDRLAELYEKLVQLTGLDAVLPMNTGAEAVETALKAARKWGYQVKGVPADRAEIIVCENGFHGRTITIVSFSSEANSKDGFGPFTPGFVTIEYGNEAALEAAINDNTVAFLVEPIQGEGGVLIPPDGFLKRAEQICRKHRVLLMLDEIQTGLARTGRMFCYEHEQVRPDVLTLGKALGGGLYPVSAVVATREVMDVFQPGQHGSTFGGNPLAAAVGVAALDVLVEDRLAERSDELGRHLMQALEGLNSPRIAEVRGKGLLVGIQLTDEAGPARRYSEALMAEGLLCKETHETVLRLAPPLVVDKDTLDWSVELIGRVLAR